VPLAHPVAIIRRASRTAHPHRDRIIYPVPFRQGRHDRALAGEVVLETRKRSSAPHGGRASGRHKVPDARATKGRRELAR